MNKLQDTNSQANISLSLHRLNGPYN